MGIRVKKGVNDLLTTHPELSKEWHPTLNGDLTPSDVTAGSNKKVFWQCHKCSYKWAAVVNNRANLGRGCPCCANKVVVKGVNDLATTHPEIAKEWYQPDNGDITPSDVTHGSGKKYSWICPRGHVYLASVLHRTSGVGTGCPICNSGRQTSFAEQALLYYVRKIFPNAINSYKGIFTKGMELDIFIPDLNLGIEYDGVYWHHRKPATYERERRKYEICKSNGIKLLRVREKMIDENESPAADESIFLPENESETVALTHTIQMVLAKIDPESNMWTRKRPHQVWSNVDVDVERDKFDILSYLSGPVKDSLAEVAPELVEEWDDELNGKLKPDMVKAGSTLRVNWRCRKCQHRWITDIYHRAKDHTGCPRCAGQVFEKGINDFATKNPELLIDWDYEKNNGEGIFPDEIQFNSSTKVNWKCHECSHEWKLPLRSRTVCGDGCIKCGYAKTQSTKQKQYFEKYGCITDPLLLKEWDHDKNSAKGLFPDKIHPRSSKVASWICSVCGHRWDKSIRKRSDGSGCRKCADKQIGEIKSKAVEQLSTEGELIKLYRSTGEAANEFGLSSGAISHACRKGTKSAGYYWKYHQN